MADRYWRGGSGTWNGSSTTNWSATDGGAGGASAPTSADNVFITPNSLGGLSFITITITTGATCANFTHTTSGGFVSLTVNTAWTIYGSWSSQNNLFLSYSTGSTQVRMEASSGARTFATGTDGISFHSSTYFYILNNGATWTLSGGPIAGGLQCSFSAPVNFNGVTITLRNVIISNASSTLNGVIIAPASDSLYSSIQLSSSTGYITGTGTPIIRCNNPQKITEVAIRNNVSWPGRLEVGNLGCILPETSTSYNNGISFDTITNVSSTPGKARLTLPSAKTVNVTNFTLNGSGTTNQVTIDSTTPGSRAFLSKPSGVVAVQYMNIKDSAATGGATWNATNSTNSGNNTGWNITAPIPSNGLFFGSNF